MAQQKNREHSKFLFAKVKSGPAPKLATRAIRFFGTEDYWFLGTIELGRSENDIKSLGRWVTGSLGLWVTRLLGH